MKNLFTLCLLLIFMACNNDSTQQDASVNTPESEPVNTLSDEKEKIVNDAPTSPPEEANAAMPMGNLLGAFVGMFEASEFDESKKPSWANKINITIDKIDGNTLLGHSVVAGNNRPFEGSINFDEEADGYLVTAKEPGDDRYDGVFRFVVEQDGSQLNGTWEANRKSLAVTERTFNLEKRVFKYDPTLQLDEEVQYDEIYNTYNHATDEAEFLTKDVFAKNPSLEELQKVDVENMYSADLEVMRNTIYARHGYSFKNRKMRYVFNYVDWYIPMSTDIRNKLTDLEKKNIEIIKRYEEHAERYYDAFGR